MAGVMSEPMKTVSKLRIGEEQLDSAIDLMFAEKYVSALTLAGAAEEIFGRLVEFHKGTPAIQARVAFRRAVYEKRPTGMTRTDKQHRDSLNFPRNTIKHLNMKIPGNSCVNISNFRREVMSMLDRATRNYSALGARFGYKCDVELCRKVAKFRADLANYS